MNPLSKELDELLSKVCELEHQIKTGKFTFQDNLERVNILQELYENYDICSYWKGNNLIFRQMNGAKSIIFAQKIS